MERTSIAAEAKLEVNCRVVGDSLRINYVLQNSGKAALIAYDGVTGDGEWPNLDRQVYVSYQTPGELQVKRIRPTGPKGMRTTYAVVPLVSATLPRQERQVQFNLPLPVTEFNVNFPPDSSVAQYEKHRADKVTLIIGYFWQQAGTELRPLERNPKIFQPSGRFGEQLFVSSTCSMPVEVRVRTDAIFERQ